MCYKHKQTLQFCLQVKYVCMTGLPDPSMIFVVGMHSCVDLWKTFEEY